MRDHLDVARAACMLVIADALVRVLPFTTIAARIKRETPWLAPPAESARAVTRVGWAVAAAQRRLPWTVRCLAQAVAANRMLAARGVPSELWLGVNPSHRPGTDAHAWLVADDRMVTGAAGRERYVPLTTLKTPPPNRA